MKRFRLVTAAFLVAILGLVARGGDEKKGDKKGESKEEKKEVKGEKGKEATYESPDEVFAAFAENIKKADGKAILNCLTETAATRLTGELAASGPLMKSLGADGGKGLEGLGKLVEMLAPVAARHGLTAEATGRIDRETLFGQAGSPPDFAAIQKVFARLAKHVKNRSGFISDVLKAYQKFSSDGGGVAVVQGIELKKVFAKQESSFGMAMVTLTKGQRMAPVAFKKGGSGWKIEYPPSLLPDVGLPMLPPPPELFRPGGPAPKTGARPQD